jgi:Flp pilus assembly protein TadG
MSPMRRHPRPLVSTRVGASGQGLAEFALVLLPFLMLVFAVVDGGRAIFAYNQVSEATRYVARAATTTCFATSTPCDQSSGAIATAIAEQRAGLQGPVTWTVRCVNPADGSVPDQVDTFCKVGDLVRVTVTSNFNLITPVVAQAFGPVNVGSTTDQEILQ